MRIHSDHLNSSDFYEAARIARVDLDLNMHGSRSRRHGWNVILTGESKRRPNSGTRGAGDEFAATWDQWGVFLAVLFDRDDERAILVTSLGDTERLMVTPYYASADAFAAATGDRFGAPEDVMTAAGYRRVFKSYGWPEDAHGDHTFRNAGTPYEQTCTKCTAVQRRGVRAEQFVS